MRQLCMVYTPTLDTEKTRPKMDITEDAILSLCSTASGQSYIPTHRDIQPRLIPYCDTYIRKALYNRTATVPCIVNPKMHSRKMQCEVVSSHG